MNHRFFAGRQVKASLNDGQQKFHKSGPGPSSKSLVSGTSTDLDHQASEEEQKRLEAFAQYLEGEDS